MKLTATKVKKATCPPNKKQVKFSDGHGMYLLVMASGSKYWRLDYSIHNARKTLALGIYPQVSLSEARDLTAKAKRSIAKNIDPINKKVGQTFGDIYEEWLLRRKGIIATKTYKNIGSRMKSVLPSIHKRKPEDITPPLVLSLLHKIEDKGTIHTAYKVKGIIGQVMRYAIATGRAEFDPTPSLRGALKPENTKSRPTLLEPSKIGELIASINSYKGPPSIKYGLLILMNVFTRPGELRYAEHQEFNFEEQIWNVPENRMKVKGRGDHIVPLSNQVIQYLQKAQTTSRHRKYILRGQGHNKPLSENAFSSALKTIGYPGTIQTAHGFRAMARSLLAEQGWPIAAIERQLAHSEDGRVAKAYARAEYLDVRRKMMQAWSDYLDTL